MRFDPNTIYTDAEGRPIPCPRPEDFEDTVDFFRARWAWEDKLTDMANKAFGDQFKEAMKHER